jgi:DNA-directed RNA polymerase subunit F
MTKMTLNPIWARAAHLQEEVEHLKAQLDKVDEKTRKELSSTYTTMLQEIETILAEENLMMTQEEYDEIFGDW